MRGFSASLLHRCLPGSFKNWLKWRCGGPDMRRSLVGLKDNGFYPSKIVDIGAYEGTWSSLCLSVFPNSQALLVEIQESKFPALERLADRHPGRVSFTRALLGAKEVDEIEYLENESVTSVLPEYAATAARPKKARMQPLDRIMESHGWSGTDFLKLDVQGYELEVLRGGPKTLASAEVVLLEISLIEINRGAPLLTDVLQYMAAHSFRPYDICSLIRRPLDRALWQVDMIFAHKGSELIRSHHWA